MRGSPILTVFLLVLSTVGVSVSATTEDGLTVLLLVSPDGVADGQVIDVYVEAYLWGEPTDLDSLFVQAGLYPTDPIPMTAASTGKWHGTYTVDQDFALYGALPLSANGALGSAHMNTYNWYPLVLQPEGWQLLMRVANPEVVGSYPGPGASVVVEGRSYFDGQLADGGPLNLTYALLASGATAPTMEQSPMDAISEGVYRTTVQFPGDIDITTDASLTVQLGPSGQAASTYKGYTLDPFQVLATAIEPRPGSIVVQIIADDNGEPIDGADIEISGTLSAASDPTQGSVSLVEGATDAEGHATVTLSYNAHGGSLPGVGGTGGWNAIDLRVNVSDGNRVVVADMDLEYSGNQAWISTVSSGSTCSLFLETDTGLIEVGSEAELTFLLAEDGELLDSEQVPLFVWMSGEGETAVAEVQTTSPAGEITTTVEIPDDWDGHADTLHAEVVCPGGDGSAGQARVGWVQDILTAPDMEVTITGDRVVGEVVHVRAVYTGDKPFNEGWATVLISDSLFGPPAGGPPPRQIESVSIELGQVGDGVFEGEFTVTAWMAKGGRNFEVFMDNEGTTEDIDDWVEPWGYMELGFDRAPTDEETPSDGQNPGGSQGGAGGDSAPVAPEMVIGVGAAAAAGVAAVALAARRKKRSQ